MSNQLVKAQTSLTQNYSNEEIDLLKNDICKGARDNELVYFLKVCQTLSLNPFTKQIYSLPFKGGRVVIIGIDGLRSIAHRTGEYIGCEPAKFTFEKPGDKVPLSAEVTVYRLSHGERAPFRARVFMDEYKPKFSAPMWEKFPKRMLEKCAHALALKEGFSIEMSGLYTPEEMDQAKDDDQPQGKIIDLETLAKKEKPFNQKEYIDLIKSYCATKNQEGVDKPIHNILDFLDVETKGDDENKNLIINLDEGIKKELMKWLAIQLK